MALYNIEKGFLLMSVLPEDFLQFLCDTYGTEAASAWFQRLPSLLEECVERWQLKLLPPFENLSFHYVAPAERADGTPVILKTCSLTDEFAHGVAALRIEHEPGRNAQVCGNSFASHRLMLNALLFALLFYI
jgi:hypothetical protein